MALVDETQRRRWNDAVRTGDVKTMELIASEALNEIHRRQLDDWNVHERTQA